MAKRAHSCQCRATRGIPSRTCVDCGLPIDRVMYDRCGSCDRTLEARRADAARAYSFSAPAWARGWQPKGIPAS